MSEKKWTPQSEMWADDHKILLCDYTTGHAGQVFAMCESDGVAEYLADAANAISAGVVEALEELDDALTDGLCNSGLPDFDRERLDRARNAAKKALSLARGQS